jgi:uncharacterized integral membrane protein (TIGR00697 family)
MLEILLQVLNSFQPELMLIIEFGVAILLMLGFLKFFGLTGMYAYLISSLFIANIQVLKVVQYGFYPLPVALGKVIICCSFFAIDVIAEFYGKENARKAVWLGLSSNVMIMVLMFITLGYKPLVTNDPGYASFLIHNESMKDIFLPLPNILIAGIVSYLISQYIDIYLFTKLKEKTREKFLWVRAFFAPAISSLIDNTIFYSLAFYVLSSAPLKGSVLIYTYILGTYIFRLGLIFVSSYVLYVARWVMSGKKEIKAKSLSTIPVVGKY